MGIPVARIGDVGVGTDKCHTSPKDASGIIINGAGTVRAEGVPVGYISSIVVAGDGHTGIIITGAGTVTAEGIPVAQLGSIFVGCFTGIMVSAAGTVGAG